MNEPIIKVRDLDLWYGEQQALRKISMDIPERSITMRQIHVPAEYQPDERPDSGLPGGRNLGVPG